MSNPLALIIEDDPDAAAIFAEALRAADFVEIEIIGTGDKALERLSVAEPAIVVLDMHLPQVAGPDILRYIRNEKRLAKTQIIIATADPSMADMLHEQADLVLLKPISFSQLRDLAKRLRSFPRSAT